jgi:hypothetical protein
MRRLVPNSESEHVGPLSWTVERCERDHKILPIELPRKNNYSVGPVITDEEGEFALDDCNFAITRAQKIFAMGYHSTLAECLPVVEVSLHPAEKVNGMIHQYRSAPYFWGMGFRDPEGLMNALQEARNEEYEPALLTTTEAEILSNPRVELLISRRQTTM